MANVTPNGGNPNVRQSYREEVVVWSSDHIDVLAVALAKDYVAKHRSGAFHLVVDDVAVHFNAQLLAIAELFTGPAFTGTLRGIIDGLEPVVHLINRASVEGINGKTLFRLKASAGSKFSTALETPSGNSYIVESMDQATAVEDIGLASNLAIGDLQVVHGSNISVLTAHATWSDDGTCIVKTARTYTALSLAVASAFSVQGVDGNSFESLEIVSATKNQLWNRDI